MRSKRRKSPPQSVDKVCFISHFRKTPGEGFPLDRPSKDSQFTFPALLEGIRVFRPLRRSTKDAVFGNCKPLKRLDLNFQIGFATSPCGKVRLPVFIQFFSQLYFQFSDNINQHRAYHNAKSSLNSIG